MLSYEERVDYFMNAVQHLNTIAAFNDIVLEGKPMEKQGKKNSFWSTTHFSGYRDIGTGRDLTGEAKIYANLRDLQTEEAILEAIDHEANHIVPMAAGYYTASIRKHLKEVSNEQGDNL